MNKQTKIIITLAILLIVAIGFIGFMFFQEAQIQIINNAKLEGYNLRLWDINQVVSQCKQYTYTFDLENKTQELNLILAECLEQ